MEWNDAQGGGYSYSTFCRRYREYTRAQSVVYKNHYEPGEKMLSDYAGAGLRYIDESGIWHEAEIFVSVLGASNRIYSEATESQKSIHWINSHCRAFSFFGGVTSAVVVDNLKSGVNKPDRYEPEIARAFEEFAAHYGTTVLPARAAKPRDKAKVEKAVQDVERWVLAPLRKRYFRSAAEINLAMKPLLEALNNREMREYGASRNELFEQIEQGGLKPLPYFPFVAAEWKRARVALDYHIQIGQHWYSVPYYFTRQEVWVKITEKLVEVFHNNKQVACHARSAVAFRYTTVEAHMPPAHRAVRSWTAENFISWAKGIGAATSMLVTRILEIPRHKEQAFRSILGIQRLEKKFGAIALERAAAAALERRLYSQRALRQILEFTHTGKKSEKDSPPVTHGNLRGSTFYH